MLQWGDVNRVHSLYASFNQKPENNNRASFSHGEKLSNKDNKKEKWLLMAVAIPGSFLHNIDLS